MKNFPVTTSTLSAKELGKFVSEKYGLSEHCECTLFRTGINHTYKVSDKEKKYMLRIYFYNWRTQSEILAEINLLNLLKEYKVGISFPVADKSGDFIQNIHAPEGMRHAVLFSFAEGEKIRFMDKETCFAVGSMMADMHNITHNQKIERTNYNAETLVKHPYEYAKLYFREFSDEMKIIKRHSEEISRIFSGTNMKNIQGGIVHMDIWYDNMNITEAKDITIFDFDFCGNAWFILDIAYFCKQLFHIEADKEVYERKRQHFLDGYQSKRKLHEDELKLIPSAGAAVWIFYLGVQCQRFDWSNIFLTENYLKMYVGKMQSWLKYFDKID